MKTKKTAEKVEHTAIDLVDRAHDFATGTALPVVRSAAAQASDVIGPAVSSAARAAKPRIQDAADQVRPVLQQAASRAQQTATDTVIPALHTAASSAGDRVGDLWDLLSESEQAQELSRRASNVAAGAKGEKKRRWPLLAAGIGLGLAVGAVLKKRKAAAAAPPAVEAPAA